MQSAYLILINSLFSKMRKLLLIYTGGTIGMIKNKVKSTLVPFNFDELLSDDEELQQKRDQIEEKINESLDMFKRFQKYN